MTISREQFEIVGDYSGLEDLHIYGDFLNLYRLPIKATIAEAGELYRELVNLDDRIFNLYVSYVMARAGYYSEMMEDVFPEEWLTTDFNDEDFLENLFLFDARVVGDEEYSNEWDMFFRNDRLERIKIIFVTLLESDENPITGEYDEATHLCKRFDDSTSNYVLVHPRLSRKAKKTFMKTKEQMKQIFGKDIVLSTGEFVSRFIPDQQRKQVVEENWRSLRSRIIGNLQKEWPILVYAIHDQQLSQIAERLKKARLSLERGIDLEESVRDAGISCEAILQVLNSIYSKKKDLKMEFSDLLSNLKGLIIDDFGPDIFNDLNLIRCWRNKVSHPPVTPPSRSIADKIVTKSELFHTLFLNQLKKSPSWKN